MRPDNQARSSTRATSVDEERMVNRPPDPTRAPAALAVIASPLASMESMPERSKTTDG